MNEHLSNTAFRLMALAFRVKDLFSRRTDILAEFEMMEGMHVVDYGCGPGSYLRAASRLVGKTGLVTAVDIHPLAIQAVNERAFRLGLTNVMGLLTRGYDTPLDDHSVHIVYAMDMFHMVDDPTAMLTDIRRILVPEGVLFMDSGHQPDETARKKITDSGQFTIQRTTDRYFQCRPEP
ncbi:class I SAM-dependent methyltransferase [Desulfoluna spongiiphila]|uniref:Methyltransferase domain-containing protein n=1 Tax=Desulfoluna spongiiphila TaxID=419481 RepID=A0A1G5ENA1_9BACT|nr:class I SAM-dependent methyltransferase [Desulfoluna spongiiphila]SCY28404.1 Methyltransferase domain-containing protein [Desulfoluna spongiiphila]